MWGRREMPAGFSCENLKESGCLENLAIDERIISKLS
jgi:hypothetical protein